MVGGKQVPLDNVKLVSIHPFRNRGLVATLVLISVAIPLGLILWQLLAGGITLECVGVAAMAALAGMMPAWLTWLYSWGAKGYAVSIRRRFTATCLTRVPLSESRAEQLAEAAIAAVRAHKSLVLTTQPRYPRYEKRRSLLGILSRSNLDNWSDRPVFVGGTFTIEDNALVTLSSRLPLDKVNDVKLEMSMPNGFFLWTLLMLLSLFGIPALILAIAYATSSIESPLVPWLLATLPFAAMFSSFVHGISALPSVWTVRGVTSTGSVDIYKSENKGQASKCMEMIEQFIRERL